MDAPTRVELPDAFENVDQDVIVQLIGAPRHAWTS